MKTLPIKLAHGEEIIAVVPERVAGPGWANAPIWVHIRTTDERLRSVCIQPSERNAELHALFSPGEAMCKALLAAVPCKRARKT